MSPEFKTKQATYSGPFANIFVIVIGALAIALSLVIGIVAFIGLATAVLVFGVIVGLRLWWLGRKLPGKKNSPQSAEAADKSVIEGEYQVIEKPNTADDSNQT